jgi:hypothetical protein
VFGTYGLLEVSADSYHGLEDSIAGHTRKNFPIHCDDAAGKMPYGFLWILVKLILTVILFLGLENRDYDCKGSATLTMRHPSIRKIWH